MGIFVGISLGNIAAGILASFEMQKEFKNSKSSLAEVSVWQDYKNDFKRVFRRR